MPRPRTNIPLSERIQQLVTQRQQHAETLALIDATLGQITSLLGPRKPGRKPALASAAVAIPTPAPASKPRKRRRKQYATTGEQSILDFVKANNPTTAEIRRHWSNEGRKGTSDNVLSLLVKDKKLKRTPLKDQRGSRYSLA